MSENGTRGTAARDFAWQPAPASMPIPNRLNIVITLATSIAALTLLSWASQLDSWAWRGAAAVLFSYVLLTNYALLHEAAHGNLHTSPWGNYVLGFIAGCWFPMPVSLMRATHQGHHLRNRTDFEMFDLYYAHESRVIRFAQWYGILCGLFWPWIPLGAFLFAFCPGVLRTRIWRQARSSRLLVADIRGNVLTMVRRETVAIIAIWVAVFWLLDLHWPVVLLAYACFSFNWSTRQYVGHAFTQRDVVEGAWNLRHWSWMSWLLLHMELDLNHHRHPEVPWYYLPLLTKTDDTRPAYWRQYLRLWMGPRRCEQPAPESLHELPLSIHSP